MSLQGVNHKRLFGLDDSELIELTQPGYNPVTLHQDVAEPWQELVQRANSNDIYPVIVSGYRSFDRQLSIWQRKFNRQALVKDAQGNPLANDVTQEQLLKSILTWSAVPGFSRHHWGSDMDIFDLSAIEGGHKVQLEPWEFEQPNGPCYKLNQWLTENLQDFDFFRPYQNIENGVANEPWHISYQPVASKFLAQLDEPTCHNFLKQQQFPGSDWLLQNIKFIYNNYICNIATAKSPNVTL